MPHVTHHVLDPLAAIRARLPEETVQRLLRPIAHHVQQSPLTGIQLIHQRQVFVTLLPRRSEYPRCLTPTQSPCSLGQKPSKRQCDRRFSVTPRNLPGRHTLAMTAVHSTHPVDKEDGDLQYGHKLKTTSLLRVVYRTATTAARTDRPAPRRGRMCTSSARSSVSRQLIFSYTNPLNF